MIPMIRRMVPLLVLASPATAQGDAAADARCLAALSMMQDIAGAADKPALGSAMMFFLGKMVGRGGAASVAPALERAAAGVTREAAPGIANTCADQLTAATDAM